MDPVTHVATGVLLSQLLPGPSRVWSATAGVFFAVLPDIDYFLLYFDKLAYLKHHRGLPHSLVALPLLALLGAVVGRALGGPRWFRPLVILGLAVLASHVLLDLATSYGTQVLNPFDKRKFSLDWLFIVDPYLTALLTAGAAAAFFFPGWGQKMGAVCLVLAGGYFLLCGFYHHQALNLARQVFQPEIRGGAAPAALPQPFSCRRWMLLATGPRESRQVFVQLPYLPWGEVGVRVKEMAVPPVFLNPSPQTPTTPFRPPRDLLVLTWPTVSAPGVVFSSEAQHLLESYLDFARFPLLARAEAQGEGMVLTWLDLRFAVPGRPFPFVLRLDLDDGGRLRYWELGHGSGKKGGTG